MPSIVAQTFRVLRKDLRIELASKEMLMTTLLFGIFILVIAVLGFYTDRNAAKDVAPGALWMAVAFSGMMAVFRTWQRERERGVMDVLLASPLSANALFYGKASAAMLVLTIVDIVFLAIAKIFFHLPIDTAFAWLALLLWLGTLGFVFAATLFSALLALADVRDLTISLVVFPLITPAILAGVVASREVYISGAAPIAWLQILLAFDLFFLIIPAIIFEATVRE